MNVLVVANSDNGAARDASLMLQTYFASQNIDCCAVGSQTLPGFTSLDKNGYPVQPFLAELGIPHPDLAVALGGDGTILRTARVLCGLSTPLLGINFGHLGFLANASDEGVVAIVSAALAGDATEERRANLRIDVICDNDAYDNNAEDEDANNKSADGASEYADEGRSNYDRYCGNNDSARPARSFFALNEIAVTRGTSGRVIDFNMNISGSRLTSMRGDGAVVCTATGSTAYGLSAGGPLCAPGFRGMVVAPLAAHTLCSRPLVTDPSDVVELEISSEAGRGEASLFADGELLSFDSQVRRVIVRTGDTPTTLLRYRHEGFYAQASRVFFQ